MSMALVSKIAINKTHSLVLSFNPFTIDFISFLPPNRLSIAFVMKNKIFKTEKYTTFNRRDP